jgi:hypothetical protein
VTCTVPPLPVPAVFEVALAPAESAIAPPAVNTTSPAWPVEPGWAEAVTPLAPLGPTPDNVTPLAMVTAMSPPLPGPAVVLAICAPPEIVKLLGARVTDPAGPDCGPVAEAKTPVLATAWPSSSIAPGVVTVTDPPAPVPAVVLPMPAPVVTVICGAVTATDPALPLAVAEAMIPVLVPLRLKGP